MYKVELDKIMKDMKIALEDISTHGLIIVKREMGCKAIGYTDTVVRYELFIRNNAKGLKLSDIKEINRGMMQAINDIETFGLEQILIFYKMFEFKSFYGRSYVDTVSRVLLFSKEEIDS